MTTTRGRPLYTMELTYQSDHQTSGPIASLAEAVKRAIHARGNCICANVRIYDADGAFIADNMGTEAEPIRWAEPPPEPEWAPPEPSPREYGGGDDRWAYHRGDFPADLWDVICDGHGRDYHYVERRDCDELKAELALAILAWKEMRRRGPDNGGAVPLSTTPSDGPLPPGRKGRRTWKRRERRNDNE